MDLAFAFLCDAAQEHGGKVAALGIGIDTLYVPDLQKPAHHFTLVFNLQGSATESGRKHIEVHLIDQDGRDVVPPFVGEAEISRPQGPRFGIGILFEYNNIKFPAYGNYHISIVVDGHEFASLPLIVAPPPKSR